MAIQVNYPGVYIEEFTPGAPIEGVGTSTAAFIGTAASGPIDKPKLIQSWDAFAAIFGEFISGPTTGYLAPAVYGFFLNGGTTCYVVRHGTGSMAKIDLPSWKAGEPPALVATALQEGTAGNNLRIKVSDSSILADALKGAGTSIRVQQAKTNVSKIDTPRTKLTVADTTGFAIGDSISLTSDNNKNASATIALINKNTKEIELTGPVDAALVFNGGTGSIRIADLPVGTRTFRLDTSTLTNVTLGTILPPGATIKISGYGPTGNQITPKIYTIESLTGDWVTVIAGLKDAYGLGDTAKPTNVESLEFDLEITDTATNKREKFERLSMGTNHPNYWGRAVNSQYVDLALSNPPAQADDPRPQSSANVYSPTTAGVQDNPAAAWSNIVSNADVYLKLLSPIDEISLVCIPGATTMDAQLAMIAHCETMADRFAILDSGIAETVETISDQLARARSEKGFAALYFPWILAYNPLHNQNELWPPSGHLAGIYARSDNQYGVHKAPANIAIRGALGLQHRLTDIEQGPLNLKGLNVLRVFQGQAQPMVWGARTTATDRSWQYVNIRRLFLFLEESIQEGIRWAVFEPNNLQLWQKLKRTITEFLSRVWRDGALFGATANEAFYVRIDEVLNPDSTRALGRLYIEIGVRPSYPAEFIIVRIGIWQGGTEVNEG